WARPVIRRDLGEIWWTTALEGFHVVKFRAGVWPFPGMDPCPRGYDYYQDQYDLKYRTCGSGHHPGRRARARRRHARKHHAARRGRAHRTVQPARYSNTDAAIALANRAAQQGALLCHLLPMATATSAARPR